MKILFLSHYSGLLGSNRSLDSLISYFSERGENISILLPSKGDFYQHLKDRGCDVHFFMYFYETLYIKKNKKYLLLPILWIYNLVVLPLLIYKIFKIGPDVIYTNSSSDLYSVFIAKIIHKKHVIHVREFMQEDFGGYCIFGRKLKKQIILKSDKIIFVSNAVAHKVVGVVPKNGRVIYNGLAAPLMRYQYEGNKNHLRIGLVGNIDISKQQHLAIMMMPAILEKFPNVSLHLIGDKNCPYKRYIKKLVEDLDLNTKVIFEGFIKNTETIYSKFDVLLMCSRSEAFGRVTIEGMLRYKPIIGFDAGGTSELIDDRLTGFKFKTVEEVINSLDIIVNHPQKAKEIVENAHERALDTFSEKSYTENVYRFVTYGL